MMVLSFLKSLLIRMLATLNHVDLKYGANKPVLSGIDLSLEEGSFYFLTGPSGAGKSSLLRLIYGAEKPSAGKITLFGEDLSSIKSDRLARLRRRLGFIFQDFRLLPHLTALENAALPLRLAGADQAKAEAHVRELLRWVGLGNRMDALPAALSGGEQQRVAIARAVVSKPKLLLADEPTGNVDASSALKLLHLLVELNKMGTSVLFATHQLHLVDKIGKPALHLAEGHLIGLKQEAA